MNSPVWPEATRRAHASGPDLNSPSAAGIVRVDSRHSREIETLPRLGAHLGRVDEPVAAHPDLIIHILRQIGDHVTPLIVGHDHLGEFGRQFSCLGDYPHAGFRPGRPAHCAADIVVVDRDWPLDGPALRIRRCRSPDQRQSEQRRATDHRYR